MWRLSNFRFLIIVMSLGVLAMLPEITNTAPDAETDLPYFYMMMDLYPERGESLFYRGLDAARVGNDLEGARALFEEAIRTGLKTEEELFWRYAEVLIGLGASESEINDAIALWRHHFPFSERPDPREMLGQSGGQPAK